MVWAYPTQKSFHQGSSEQSPRSRRPEGPETAGGAPYTTQESLHGGVLGSPADATVAATVRTWHLGRADQILPSAKVIIIGCPARPALCLQAPRFSVPRTTGPLIYRYYSFASTYNLSPSVNLSRYMLVPRPDVELRASNLPIVTTAPREMLFLEWKPMLNFASACNSI